MLIVCAVLFGAFPFDTMPTSASAENSSPVIDRVREMLDRYPESEVRDVYKLLFQAYHGAEHALVDESAVRRFLEIEWRGIGAIEPDESHPLFEPVFIPDVTPPLFRLHLGPAKASGMSVEIILDEFVKAGSEFPVCYPVDGRELSDAFQEAWAEVGRAISEGNISLGLEDYSQFSAEMEAAGWPPVHHSEAYCEAYNPHYRLVEGTEFRR